MLTLTLLILPLKCLTIHSHCIKFIFRLLLAYSTLVFMGRSISYILTFPPILTKWNLDSKSSIFLLAIVHLNIFPWVEWDVFIYHSLLFGVVWTIFQSRIATWSFVFCFKIIDDPDVRYTAVSSFIFLRFFAPAILSPNLFHLTPHHPVSTSASGVNDEPNVSIPLRPCVLFTVGSFSLFGF